MQFQAVNAAQGSVAASTKLKVGGTERISLRPNTRYLAATPLSDPPSVRRILSSLGGPSFQSGKKHPTTRSPVFHSVTPEPTAATSPAPSERTMRFSRFCHDPYLPSRMSESRKFTAAA